LAVDAKLKEYQAAYMAAVDSFINRYTEIRDAMLERYSDYRDRLEPFYPGATQLRRFFYFQWNTFEIGESGIAQGEITETYQRFKDNLQAQFDEFLMDAVVDLRYQVQETCLKVAERVSKGEIVNGNSINSLNSMIDKFTNLNFVGDKKIEDQLGALRATLWTTDAAALKENDALKNQLGIMAAQIAKEAADISDVSAITNTYKRKLDME
jgi:hypothetical protein